MLVRQVETNVQTGEVTERWVEIPDVVTPEVQQAVDAQVAAVALTERTNEQTIGGALESALTANAAALSTLTTWRTTGPGAGTANLSAAQEAQALRQLADNQIAAIKQLNGLIRLIRRKLDTAEAAAGPKL